MDKIFLSPSTQEYNPYVDGGNEEYYMNIITDALIPYLEELGISYERNDPSKRVGSSVRQSNAYAPGLHLALHSNAAPPASQGLLRGSDVYYYKDARESERAASIFANNLRLIYPLPGKVRTVPTTELYELNNTAAPAILIELAYHDNRDDARWIRDNIENIAKNLSVSVADFFGINDPMTPEYGVVVTENTALNLRSAPSISSDIIGKIPKGESIPVYDTSGEWIRTYFEGKSGYVNSKYIQL